jgi:hypothetical protein
MNILTISVILDAITEKGDTSTQKEALRRVLATTEIRNLMDGGVPKDIAEWFVKAWQMPSVKVWFQILWKYEGLAENVDSNFISDFNDIADTGTGPNPQSITEINSKLELLMEPAAKAFTSVQDLCDHMRICALVKIIKRWARGSNKQAEAWKLADNAIVDASKTNTLLNMTLVNSAIALAQRHLDREDDEDEEEHVHHVNPELAALKLELEEQKKVIAAFATNSQAQGRQQAQGGKPGEQKAGAGKRQRTGNPREEWKQCTICGKKHPGKPPESQCFQRDLAGEKAALDELIKKKASAGFVPKGKDDKDRKEQHWKARVAFIEDAENKADGKYSLSLHSWTPTLLKPDDYSVVTLNVTQGACVDSGSPVDITFLKDEVNLSAGPQVWLNGILEGTAPAEPGICHFPTLNSAHTPVVIKTNGKGLFFKGATSKILSLAGLLEAGFRVDFENGSTDDPQFGGTITAPDGTVIIMVYENRTWRLPMLTQDKAHEIAQAQYLRALPVEVEGVDSNNPWKALLDIPEEDERALRESTKPADETKSHRAGSSCSASHS